MDCLPLAHGMRIEHRVQFQEVDAAGVVFFGAFFTMAHQAYEQALLDVGFDLATVLAARTFGFPLVHAEADYRHFLRFGDQVAIDVACTRIGDRSFTMRYAFSLAATATDVATVTLIHACVDLTSAKSVAVPCTMIAALERLR